MTNKINLYVNSSNKKTDEITTNLKCVIPSGLLPSYGKDYFTMSITSFYCYNTFYQMDSTNNEFNLIIKIKLSCYINRPFIFMHMDIFS